MNCVRRILVHNIKYSFVVDVIYALSLVKTIYQEINLLSYTPTINSKEIITTLLYTTLLYPTPHCPLCLGMSLFRAKLSADVHTFACTQ